MANIADKAGYNLAEPMPGIDWRAATSVRNVLANADCDFTYGKKER